MAVKEYCQYFRSAVEAKPAVVGVGTENSLSLPTEVLTRRGSLLLTKLPSSRRGHQPKHVGFFSPVNQPYRSFGSLPESHVFEWLAHSFEIKPPKYTMYSRPPVSWKQIESCQLTTPLIRVPMINSRQKGTTQPINLLRAGMSTLQVHMAALEKSSQGTYIGIPYNCTIIGRTDKKSGNELVPHRPECSASIAATIMTSYAASRFKRTLERSVARRNKIQAEEAYLSKLQFIMNILCFLHNVKSRDLKGKMPLQASVVQNLCLHYPPVFKDRNGPDSGHGTRQFLNKLPHEGHAVHEKKAPNLFDSRIPPWHMQVVFIDEKEEARGDIETRLKMCYDRFKQLKIDNSWKMKEEIEERARVSSRLLQLKLNELRFGPNPIRQFNIMRDKAKLIVKQEKQERDNKPKWFLIIQNEVQSTLKSNSAYESGLQYLEKLDLFTTAHTNEINHVLEKFCLYFMSTPAHTVCTTPSIEAIKFVLEKILKVSSKLCKQWLELRGLPWHQHFY
ncbi:PREDICTED: uncharacterized protein LOC109580617 [Amphimedon queenslandica]|uniref:Uncharacterized protein n=1 Tax=Amphimedon queenslandica TaxID=400682 RepID=A0AAN0IYM9_AMPQE|nr:PREDICTED: uncharacterized protein LOC109580617 [Amphimedon queenslandica]|eukprot:XP_019849558.1 PREDICTED: uncharacterized protein LOC109580617 [Amphimedon queenslandica]